MNYFSRAISKFTRILGLTFCGLIVLGTSFAYAQNNRSYEYARIAHHIEVQSDASIRVEETQTYSFVGQYHLGYRSVLQKSIGAITDVGVTDITTGQTYTRST